jgi:hypothetical protein
MDSTALELCLELSKTLLVSLDLNKLLKTGEYNQFVDETASLMSQNKCNREELYKIFLDSISCCVCLHKRCDITLKCNHSCCIQCVGDHYYANSNVLSCPKCFKLLEASDIQKISGNSPEPGSEDSSIVCRGCNTYKKPNKFYYTCMHLCIFCGFKRLSKNTSCYCKCNSLTNYVKDYRSSIVCAGCKNKKNICKDQVIEICNGHLICYDCSRLAWKTMKCTGCQSVLDLGSLKIIEKNIFSGCEVCDNTVESNFFVTKKCCDISVCLYCQKKWSNTKKCRACGAELPSSIEITLKSLN